MDSPTFWLAPEYYKHRFACRTCGAAHYYQVRLQLCQKCGSFYIEKEVYKSVTKQDDTPVLNLEIDRLRLDEEWSDQPKQFLIWSQQAADCQLEYDQAKAKLEVTVAEISNEIRKSPSIFGLDKVTEKAVELCIPLQPDHQLRVRKVNEARHALEVAKSAVNALEHRKRALTMLTELFIRDYYSDMTVKRTSKPLNSDGPMSDDEKAAVRSRGRRRAEEQHDGDNDTE
jgi:ribosomal protein L37E